MGKLFLHPQCALLPIKHPSWLSFFFWRPLFPFVTSTNISSFHNSSFFCQKKKYTSATQSGLIHHCLKIWITPLKKTIQGQSSGMIDGMLTWKERKGELSLPASIYMKKSEETMGWGLQHRYILTFYVSPAFPPQIPILLSGRELLCLKERVEIPHKLHLWVWNWQLCMSLVQIGSGSYQTEECLEYE